MLSLRFLLRPYKPYKTNLLVTPHTAIFLNRPPSHRSFVFNHYFLQRLEDYQRRLDLSSLKQTDNPVILELKVSKLHQCFSFTLYVLFYCPPAYVFRNMCRIKTYLQMGPQGPQTSDLKSLMHCSAVHPSEPGFDQENTDSRGPSIMENEQRQDYWFALIVFLGFNYYCILPNLQTSTLVHQCGFMKVNGCIFSFSCRAVHAPPGGHSCSATETRRASDP